MAWNDRYSWLRKEKPEEKVESNHTKQIQYCLIDEAEIEYLKTRIKELEEKVESNHTKPNEYCLIEKPEITYLRTRIKELEEDTMECRERKELEDKINSLKDLIVTLKVENAYLRGFIDGDPKNGVTMEKNFFS